MCACLLRVQAQECPDRPAGGGGGGGGGTPAAAAGPEEGDDSAERVEGEALAVLTLVHHTVSDDTVLYCLPMLAPYTALHRVPYKVSCGAALTCQSDGTAPGRVCGCSRR